MDHFEFCKKFLFFCIAPSLFKKELRKKFYFYPKVRCILIGHIVHLQIFGFCISDKRANIKNKKDVHTFQTLPFDLWCARSRIWDKYVLMISQVVISPLLTIEALIILFFLFFFFLFLFVPILAVLS